MEMPDFIVVHDRLDQFLNLPGDLSSADRTGEFEGRFADHFTDGRFRRVADRFLRVVDVEQESAGIGDLPEYHRLNVDDVLIAGEHQAFRGRRFGRCLSAFRRRGSGSRSAPGSHP